MGDIGSIHPFDVSRDTRKTAMIGWEAAVASPDDRSLRQDRDSMG